MENIKEKARELSGHIEEYVNTLYKLSEIRLIQKLADSTAYLVTGILFFVFTLLALLLGALGLGWWLGSIMDNRALGFVLAGVFCLLCLGVILLVRRNLIVPFVRKKVISKFYE